MAREQLPSLRFLTLNLFPALKRLQLDAKEGAIPALSHTKLPALKSFNLDVGGSLLNEEGKECKSKSDLLFTDDLCD